MSHQVRVCQANQLTVLELSMNLASTTSRDPWEAVMGLPGEGAVDTTLTTGMASRHCTTMGSESELLYQCSSQKQSQRAVLSQRSIHTCGLITFFQPHQNILNSGCAPLFRSLARTLWMPPRAQNSSWPFSVQFSTMATQNLTMIVLNCTDGQSKFQLGQPNPKPYF